MDRMLSAFSAEETNRKVERAVREFIMHAGGYFVVVEDGKPYVCSCAFVRTAEGVVVALTARHCTEHDGGEPHTTFWLGAVGMDAERGRVVGVERHPSRDVALLWLSDDFQRALRHRALSSDAIGSPAWDDATDNLHVWGCPSGLVDTESEPNRFGISGFEVAEGVAAVRVQSDGTLALPWREATVSRLDVDEDAPESWVERQEALVGKTIELPHPRGMSGGGWFWWSKGALTSSSVFFVERHVRLVGIQRGVHASSLIAESYESWRSWLMLVLGLPDSSECATQSDPER